MFVDGKRPLFKGATRLPRALGVPRNVAMMIFMISASLFMIIHMWGLRANDAKNHAKRLVHCLY